MEGSYKVKEDYTSRKIEKKYRNRRDIYKKKIYTQKKLLIISKKIYYQKTIQKKRELYRKEIIQKSEKNIQIKDIYRKENR